MPELKPCPFCDKADVFISVHDAEGNYKGKIGCEYESDPWSGISYALHHEGWGECILCSDGGNGIMGGILFDTAEEAAKAWNEALPTRTGPLALDELREMAGEPVWAEYSNAARQWHIFKEIVEYAGHSFVRWKDGGIDLLQDYGETWIAYRRKPDFFKGKRGAAT